jgi:predicted ATPase
VTAELVRDRLPSGAQLRDLGEHRLRDLARPEHVHQLLIQGLPADFPPLNGPDRAPGNLPVQVAGFVGRGRELARIAQVLAETRLLTLSGTGGVGKTRLALEAVAGIASRYPDGVRFVDLSALIDASLIPRTVAAAFDAREVPDQRTTETLIDAVRPKRALLVLDNCEHLIEACARLVDELLRHCPALSVLATSREPLRLAGESVLPVPPLDLPDEGPPYTVERIGQADAVRLFQTRAAAIDGGFRLTDANVEAVASICRRLDGIPLALELAAARVPTLGVQMLAERLHDRFRLLTTGSRTAPPRHQTLRAVIDWSYELLTEAQRVLFRRLSVFAGGWPLEAAEGICAWGNITEADVLDLLGELVDRSLVTSEEQAGARRLRLLETMREYAAERLAEAGETEPARDRHMHWYLSLAERLLPEMEGATRASRLRRMQAEHDNCRAALAWCAGGDDRADLGLRLATALAPFWEAQGFYEEGSRRLERFLAERPEATHELRARALHRAGSLAFMQAEYGRAAALLTESITLFELTGDRRGTADARYTLAEAVRFQGDHDRAASLFEQALALYRELDDRNNVALTLRELGVSAVFRGDLDRAVELCEESLALHRRMQDRRGTLGPLVTLARIAMLRREYQRAEGLFDEALSLSREIEEKQGLASVLVDVGLLQAFLGNHERALTCQRESLVLSRDTGLKLMVGSCLSGIAATLRRTGQPDRAVRLLAAAASIREQIGAPVPPAYVPLYEAELHALRTGLGQGRFDALWAAGGSLLPEDAIAEALDERADP